jgi:hypothetical protein
MATIYLPRGETLRVNIIAQDNGENITLDEAWAVSAWMKPKLKCAAFDLNPTIADGQASITLSTSELEESAYEFDVKLTDADGNLYSEVINLHLTATITPP